MRRKKLIWCLLIVVLVLAALIIFAFHQSKKDRALVNWKGTLIEFFVRDQKPKLGLLDAPSTLQEAVEKHIVLPGQIKLDERGDRFLAPEKAWFSDIEEYGAVFYRSYSKDGIGACNVYFFRKTPEEFITMYQKIIDALEDGFGELNGGMVTGNCGVTFKIQNHSEEIFPEGYQVKTGTWDAPDHLWAIVLDEYYEVTDGVLDIAGWDEGYVMGIYCIYMG